MSTRPDVRIRLSPEGVREVIAALKQVQQQGKAANRESTRGITALTGAVRGLARFLPTLGVGAIVAGVTALGRNALRSADAMGKLAQVAGASVENLSIFSVAAERNNQRTEEIRVSLVRLAEQLRNLRNGNTAVAASFGELNLRAEDFAGLDTVEAAEKVAIALSKISDPARRAALAKAALGEAGARLLPTLNELAETGLEGARRRAEALGLVMDEELTPAAEAALDAMGDIGLQVRGLGLAFIRDLAPAVTRSMQGVSQATEGSGARAIRAFGNVVGETIAAVINLFRLLASVATGIFDQIGIGLGATAAALGQAMRLNFAEARIILDEAATDLRQRREDANREVLAALDQLVAELTGDPPKVPAPEIEKPKTDEQLAAERALTKARLAEAKSRADQELAIQQAKLEAEADVNQRAYDESLISLQAFMDRRQEILERQAALEIRALKLQRESLAAQIDPSDFEQTDADRLQLATQIGQVENQIALRQLRLARDLATLESERAGQLEQIANEQRDVAGELDELEGRRHAAFQRNLEQELRDLRELGQRAGQSAAEIEAIVDRLSEARTTRFNFDEVQREASAALDAFQRDARQIQLDQEAGVISQLEGELRLIALQEQRLATLQQLAGAAREAAEATGDPELIARAQQYAESVAQVAASFESATNTALQLRNASIEAFEGGLTELLAGIQDVESLEDAFKSLARTVAQTLQRITAEILARQAVFALLRAFGGGGGGIAQAIATGRTGGLIRGYSGGGDIRGPRLPIAGPDKVPILAAEGEFVLQRARVVEPGALAFLRAWNAGHFSFDQALMMPRFQSGGLIGGAQAVPGVGAGEGQRGRGTRIINAIDPQFAIDAMNTASGEEVILNVIRRNSMTVKRSLDGG